LDDTSQLAWRLARTFPPSLHDRFRNWVVLVDCPSVLKRWQIL